MFIRDKKVKIYIDESGTLPDPDDQVIILAAAGFNDKKTVFKIFKKIRDKVKSKKEKPLHEIKFYNAGLKTKKLFFQELKELPLNIFILIVDKKGQVIADNPENFALLSSLLLKDCLSFYEKDQIEEIIFDRHFHKLKDQNVFNSLLSELLDRKFTLKHIDSLEDPLVNIADMVAGSFLAYVRQKNQGFHHLISDKIITENRLNWKEAKRILVNKTKKLR